MFPAPRCNSSQRPLLVLTSLLGKAVETGAHGSAKSTHVPCSQPVCADTHITNSPELLQSQVSFSTRAHVAASLQLQGQQTPWHTWGTKWGAQLTGPTTGCRYLDPPPRDIAQPGPAKRFRARAPISPAGRWRPKTLPWGALKTSAQVHFSSRAWDSLLLPLCSASATQCRSFSVSERGSCGALCIRDQEPF